MPPTTTPTLPLRQVFNFRDLGGLPTRDGRVTRSGVAYRADGLHRLQEDDRSVLDGLGLRTIVDLRTERELEEWGTAPAAATDATVHHLPVITSTWDIESFDTSQPPAEFLRDRYVDMIDEGGGAIVGVLELLAEPGNQALVFHCAAGKDRTGVVAAFLLSALGVDDATIAADFARTAPAMERMVAWYREHHPERIETMTTQPEAFRTCPPEAMLLLLDHVRERWGSMDGCLSAAGLRPTTITSLRDQLLV